MRSKTAIVIIISILVVISGTLIAINYTTSDNEDGSDDEDDGDSSGNPDVVLACDLPGEKGKVPTLVVTPPDLDTKGDAYDYAQVYFPECINVSNEFNVSDLMPSSGSEITLSWYTGDDWFAIEHFLQVYPSGCLIYSVNQYDPMVIFDESQDSDWATDIADAFIAQHGGLGTKDYNVLFMESTISGPSGAGVVGYLVRYELLHTVISDESPLEGTQIPLGGAERIVVSVGYNGSISYCFRLQRNITGEGDLVNVMDSEEAFGYLADQTDKFGFKCSGEHYNVTDIQLVYYTEQQESVQELIYPAWRFIIGEQAELYIDGQTGELLR